jgi:hypothetical protein
MNAHATQTAAAILTVVVSTNTKMSLALSTTNPNRRWLVNRRSDPCIKRLLQCLQELHRKEFV